MSANLPRTKIEGYRYRVDALSPPNVRYGVDGKVVTMIEPQINGESVSAYVERIFSVLALAIEEVMVYGFTKVTLGSLAIAEIPLSHRDPSNAQRFRRTLPGTEPLWEFRWTGKGFYES
jgi:hypothetical protein